MRKNTNSDHSDWHTALLEVLESSSDYILERTRHYVNESGYSKIVSAKESEWRKGIGGLIFAIISYLKEARSNSNISISSKYECDPIASFVRIEARLHRARGVRLEMFLALLKLMQKPFLDLAVNLDLSKSDTLIALEAIHNVFDRFELSCCAEWASHNQDETIYSLQDLNIRMTNEKNRYQTIFEYMAEPAYVVDPQMRLVAVNKSFESFFGLDRYEVLGHVCERFFNCGFCEYCYLLDAMNRRTSFSNIESTLIVQDQSKTILISGSFVDDFSGTFSGGMAIFQDITERKWAEENLIRARNTLEQKVEERTSDLSKSNKLLNIEIEERKKAEVILHDSEQRLRHLSAQLITAQEAERRRISFDLHDELGQSLVALKLRLRNIGESLDLGLHEQMEECMQDIRSITDYVRKMSKDLSPSMLNDLGLIPAIRSLFNQAAKLHYFKINEYIEDSCRMFTDQIEINIFRIFQEALNNIGKHAQASLVTIKLWQRDGLVQCIIDDDGKGFDVNQVLNRSYENRGLGLLAMEERVTMLGGEFNIHSHLGKGTSISFSFPNNFGA